MSILTDMSNCRRRIQEITRDGSFAVPIPHQGVPLRVREKRGSYLTLRQLFHCTEAHLPFVKVTFSFTVLYPVEVYL